MMRAGTKSRRQALIFMITNAGAQPYGAVLVVSRIRREVGGGRVEDDAFFPFVCGLDGLDDPFSDEVVLAEGEPSLQDADLPGISYIREQVVESGDAQQKAIVRRLNFCQWTDAESPWISGGCGAVRSGISTGRTCAAAGGSGTGSFQHHRLDGLGFLVEPIEAGEPWLLVPFAWLPDVELQRKADTDRVPYIQWKAEGISTRRQAGQSANGSSCKKLSAMCDFFGSPPWVTTAGASRT